MPIINENITRYNEEQSVINSDLLPYHTGISQDLNDLGFRSHQYSDSTKIYHNACIDEKARFKDTEIVGSITVSGNVVANDIYHPTEYGDKTRSGTNIALACAAVIAAGRGIVRLTGGTFACTNEDFLDVPIDVMKGSHIVTTTGQTVTNYNPIPHPWKLVDGLGTVRYSKKVECVYFEWRGALGTGGATVPSDDTAAIAATFADLVVTNDFADGWVPDSVVNTIRLLGWYYCTAWPATNFAWQMYGLDWYMPTQISVYPRTAIVFDPATESDLFDIHGGAPYLPSYLGKVSIGGFFIYGNTTGGVTFSRAAFKIKQLMACKFECIGITNFQTSWNIQQCAINTYRHMYMDNATVNGIHYNGNFSIGENWENFYIVNCEQAGTFEVGTRNKFTGYFENSKGFDIWKECDTIEFINTKCELIPKPADTGMLHIFQVGVNGSALAEGPQLIIKGGLYQGNRTVDASTFKGDFVNCDYTNGIVIDSVDASQVLYGINPTSNTKDYSIHSFGNSFHSIKTAVYKFSIVNKLAGIIPTDQLPNALKPLSSSYYVNGIVSSIPRQALNTDPPNDNGHIRLNACGAASQDYTRGAGIDLSGINVTGAGEVAGQIIIRTGDSAASLISLLVNDVLALKLDASGDATVYRKLLSGNDIECGNNLLIALNKAILAKTTAGKVAICGGTTDSNGTGARIRLFANDHATQPGQVDISCGNNVGAKNVIWGNTEIDTGDLSILTAGKGLVFSDVTAINGLRSNGTRYVPIVPQSVYAAGTAHTLTNTAALVDFGTTDPSLTLGQTMPYKLRASVKIDYVGATFAANQIITLKLRKTSGTPADIANSTTTLTTEIITTITKTMGIFQLPEITFSATAADVVQLWASIDTVPAAGSIQITAASIIAD